MKEEIQKDSEQKDLIGTDEQTLLSSLTKPIPDNREDCLKEICTNFITALKYSTLRFWRTGRIIDHLQENGEKGVIPEIMRRSKYDERTVRYALSVYRAFPDVKEIRDMCEKGTQWTHFRQLASLKEESERKKLVDKIMDGQVRPVDIPDTVKEVKQASKKPKKSISEDPCKYMEKMRSKLDDQHKQLDEMMMDYENVMTIAADDEKTPDATYKKFTGASQEAKEAAESFAAALDTFAENIHKDVFDEEV